MDIEKTVKSKLLSRGFSEKKQLNNRGLIGATIDETIDAVINKNAVLCSVSHSTIKIPPIGLKPKWLHDEQRQKEIKQAIERYINVGRKIPQEWLDEYNSYCG